MSKDFRKHFHMLVDKLNRGENFAFTRFSDGELRIMQNLELKLAKDHNIIGDNKNKGQYAPENLKHFRPEEHGFYRDRLMDSYRYKAPNYFVGLSCRCCVGDVDHQQMLSWYEGDTDDDHLTWSNLLVNANYPLFRKHMLPLFSKKKIVMICNRNCRIEQLPFADRVVRDFRVGPFCMVRDYPLIETVKDWVREEGIRDHVFLVSAASLSEMMIHQNFADCPDNTWIDIGSTLNRELGIDTGRGYLRGGRSLKKVCLW